MNQTSTTDHSILPLNDPSLDVWSVLHPGYQCLRDLAPIELQPTLLVLIFTTRLERKPNWFGSVLNAISSDTAFERLSEWRDEDMVANLIFDLSDFLRNHKHSLLKQFAPLPLSPTSSGQLNKSRSNIHYLIWLLTEDFTDLEGEDFEWIVNFSLWILFHAVHRFITHRIVSDKYLREASTRVRLASHKKSIWLPIVLLIKRKRLNSFQALNTALSSDAGSRRPIKQKPENQDRTNCVSERLQKTFFSSVARCANYEIDKGSDDTQKLEASTVDFLAFLIPGLNESDLEEIKVIKDPEEPFKKSWLGEDEALIVTEKDPNQSNEVNRLSVNSILLDTVMDLQNLRWSYNRPNPAESPELEREICLQLNAKSLNHRFAGVCAWIAQRTFNTFRRATDMDIADDSAPDWRMDREYKFLHRLPARMPNAWVPDTEQEKWIRPMVRSNVIPLPDEVQAIIREQCNKLDESPTFLRQCWQCSDKTIEATFKEQLPGSLKRIQPSMLRRMREQSVFEASLDSAFTKMIAFHPDYALSAAMYYGSFSRQATETALKQDDLSATEIRTFTAETEALGMGSRLSILESELRPAIVAATDKLNSAYQASDLIEYHNAFTAYAILMLMAATGCRPISDSFENADDFDLVQRFVYVEDKVSSQAHQGRIIPLPSPLIEFMEVTYPSHLRQLAKAISPFHSTLSNSISDLESGSQSEIPYFFFLNDAKRFGWHSISNLSLRQVPLLDCPLPANKFRHHLPDQLRAHGVDAEIIDGLLGHHQTGAASYGDASVRCWRTDMNSIEETIETIFALLGFTLPNPLNENHKISGDVTLVSKPDKGCYGQKNRERKRKVRFRDACKNAHGAIKAFLKGRSLTELTEDDVDQLSLSLTRNEHRLPHPDKALRLEILSREIEKTEHKTKTKVRQRNIISVSLTDRSLFESGVAGSKNTHEQARLALKTCIINSYSNMSVARGRVLAAMSLIIEDRLPNSQIARAVVTGNNFQFTFESDKAYLEFSEDMDRTSLTQASVRHSVSKQTARLLDYALEQEEEEPEQEQEQKKVVKSDPLSKKVFPYIYKLSEALGNASDITLGGLITKATKITDQLNCVEFPGVLAGYRAGRVDATSRSWADWMRHKHGLRIKIDPTDKESTDAGFDPYLAPTHLKNVSGIERHNQSREFIKDLRAIVSQDKEAEVSEQRFRQKLASAVKKFAESESSRQSELLILFAYWVSFLLTKKKNARRYLAISTVLRYLNTLSRPFQEIGYQTELTRMDSEEMTDFYCSLFEVRRVRDTGYVAERLAQFHSFCKTITHVSEPDWDELPVTPYRSVSPGYISEEDFQQILTFFHMCKDISHDVRMSIIMLLMFCYRYALRKNEALKLKREHYKELNGLTYILVIPERGGRHKSDCSLREVNLVFKQSKLESEYLEMGLQRYEALHGDKRCMPLFPDTDPDRIAAMATKGIKYVTGNPKLTLHHCRHSAAQRVGHALFLPMGISVWPELEEFNDAEERESILNSELRCLNNNTRRSTWALARYLGHARSSTSLKSYLHFLCEWSEVVENKDRQNNSIRCPKNAVQLEKLEREKELLEPPDLKIATSQSTRVTTEQLLKFLRLTRSGHPIESASKTLGIRLKASRMLYSLIQLESQNIRQIDSERSGPERSISILQKIKASAWDRLIKEASERVGQESNQHKTLPDGLSIDIWDLGFMVTSNRQLGLCKPEHYIALNAFLSDWDKIRDYVSGFYNPKSNYNAATLAIRHLGLTPVEASAKTQGVPQLDRCIDGYFQEFHDRTMIVFSENANAPARNSYEFIVLLTCWLVALANV